MQRKISVLGFWVCALKARKICGKIFNTAEAIIIDKYFIKDYRIVYVFRDHNTKSLDVRMECIGKA